jgi:ABC-type transport system involved in cytochrome c biogenesis permease subunit
MSSKLFTAVSVRAANMAGVSGIQTIFTSWLAWKRRGPANRLLFVLSLSLAAFVTLTFAWASLHPDPGNFARYFAFYWVWGLCAIGVLLGMAEYKTSPLRKGKERGHLFILLYIGALLIVTRALNMVLYAG